LRRQSGGPDGADPGSRRGRAPAVTPDCSLPRKRKAAGVGKVAVLLRGRGAARLLSSCGCIASRECIGDNSYTPQTAARARSDDRFRLTGSLSPTLSSRHAASESPNADQWCPWCTLHLGGSGASGSARICAS
jgi:hypothetical protein